MDDLEGIKLSDISQAEKDKFIWSYLYVESKTNKQTTKTNTKGMVTRRKGAGPVNEKRKGNTVNNIVISLHVTNIH